MIIALVMSRISNGIEKYYTDSLMEFSQYFYFLFPYFIQI